MTIAMPQQTDKSSTYYMLKEMSPVKGLGLPDAAENIAICTDAILQQTSNKIKIQTEMSDGIISKVGNMCDLVQAVAQQTKNEESPPVTDNFINQVNQIIAKTNGDSGKLWEIGQNMKNAIESNKATTQEEIIKASSQGGNVTADELIQKFRAQQEKVKGLTETNSDSLLKQTNILAHNRKQHEGTVSTMMKEVGGMMSRYSVTLSPTAGSDMQASNQAPAATTHSADEGSAAPRRENG